MKKLNNMVISILFIMFIANCMGMEAIPQANILKAREVTGEDMNIEKNIGVKNTINPVNLDLITSKKQIYKDNIAVKELKKLFDYIYLGEFEEFRDLLKKNPELALMVDSKGNNILIVAASYGRKEFIKFLLEFYCMNLYAINKKGENALLMATRGNYIDIVKLLVNQNSNIMRDMRFWISAFIEACENKKWDIAVYLLENFKFKDGVTSREAKYSFKRLFSIIEELDDYSERGKIEKMLKSKKELIEKNIN